MASTRERHFLALWRALGRPGWEPVEQHRFAPDRSWRLDFAWLSVRVAVEVHGGEWAGGRHGRGGGLAADAEKVRVAAALGWVVLPIAGSELDKRPAEVIAQIVAVLDFRSGKP
jgi:very-short-patch-repair endonuclease